MGCQQTKIESVVPNSWMELFAAMKLSKNDVLQLHKTFQKVDFDHSGSVDIVEMLTLLDVERTRFTEHVFTVFDSDGSGRIDFKEFVLALWNYCTIGQSSLDMFTFDLYDKDKSGKLSLEEVMMMVENLYGKNHLHDPKVKVMQVELRKMDDTGDGISIAALKEFGKHHQALLYPVFKLQHHMQESVLGVAFWRKASNRRVELCKGKYVTMSDLLYLHLDEGLYKRVIADSKNLNPKAALVVKNSGTANKRHHNDPSNVGPPPDDDLIPSEPGILPHFDMLAPPPDHHHHHHSGNHSHNHSANHSAEHHHHSAEHHSHEHNRSHENLAQHGSSHGSAHGSAHHNSAHSNSAHSNGHHSSSAHNMSSHGSSHGSTHGSTHGSSHGNSHQSGHHGHHGAVLKNTAAADDHFHHSKKPQHATGHHHSDAKVHAAY